MADIFSATNERRNSVPTATFDWSHAVHTTTDLGRITPVFCELVPAKTSARINAKLGFQFMPMVFPCQSRIRYRLAFFKYPLRALWSDYRDFIGNFRQDLEEPYLDFKGQPPLTGSLYDYLGLPTTAVGDFGSRFVTLGDSREFNSIVYNGENPADSVFISSLNVGSVLSLRPLKSNQCPDSLGVGLYFASSYMSLIDVQIPDSGLVVKYNFTGIDNGNLTIFCYVVNSENVVISKKSAQQLKSSFSFTDLDSSASAVYIVVNSTFIDSEHSNPYPPSCNINGNISTVVLQPEQFITYGYNSSDSLGNSNSLTPELSPYYDSTSSYASKQLKISAYAARAYEGVYNSWFRDNRNNPYYLNGQVEYNRWIPNYEGGADPASNYQLRYANWERDFLTTAVQTPQQGIAPLVGITTYEDTLTLEDGTVRTVNKLAITDEDGRSYKIGFDSDDNGLKAVEYQPLDNVQTVKPTSLIQLAQSGISISDLRNVNAYERYLEMNIRVGYSYKDIIEHRFDVNIGYNELLMPEFIGGTSDWVEMHSVTQTVMKEDNGTYADALGSQAGIAGARKGTETINVFCDEESIILGVLVFTPVPIYTQLLPKHFLYRGLLDHFAPEFANIGFQPIFMREVAPVQQWNADKDKMLDTFGYNRPWYEYCQKQDTAHGLYRTQLRNFIMNRVFNSAPALNQSFLQVDPDQVNDVFAVTETTDKIYGQIYFDAKFKLPIPRVAIPRLE